MIYLVICTVHVYISIYIVTLNDHATTDFWPRHHQLSSSQYLASSLRMDFKFIHFFKGFELRNELSDLKILVMVEPGHIIYIHVYTV